jgi:hypothetical protein
MRNTMQWLFPTFPRGGPSVGLLLLRAAVGVTAAIQGSFYLANSDNPTLGTLTVALVTAASGASLLLGLLTPVAGILVGLSAVGVTFSWFPPPTPNLFDAILPTVLVVVVAAAVVFLGPGALSLDARIFGRHEVIIPRTPRLPNP